ncbi:MAG: hypothetical protein GY756_08430 [bacterium]|nr:hypothetical protein [bacterium]
MIVIKIISQIYKLYFLGCIHIIVGKKSQYNISVKSLFSNYSFRITDNDKNKKCIILKYFYYTLFFLYKNNNLPESTGKHNNKAIFDATSKSKKNRIDYISLFDNSKVTFLIARDRLSIKTSLINKIIITLNVMFLTLILLPISFFSKNRHVFSLNIMYFIEWIAIIFILNKENIKYIYFFCPYDPDSNFLALLLIKNKITCEKMPSSTPLFGYCKEVVSDYVGITAPYHLDEYKQLKKNWYISKILKRPHQDFNDFIKIKKSKPKYDIGYISSGYALRTQQGRRDNELELQAEIKILNILNSTIKQQHLNLFILLHPIEQQNINYYNEAKEYYSNFFDKPINFGAFKMSSIYYFTQIDLTVTFSSNLNIQRLLNGFKGIYALLEKQYIFKYCSSLKNIVVSSPDELRLKINSSLSITSDEFFIKNKLERYPLYHNNLNLNI